MRIIELSDHPGAELRKASQQRTAAAERARADYQEAFGRHSSHLIEMRGRCQQARAQHQWWAWLRYSLALRRERRAAPRPPMPDWQPTGKEEALTAGIKGEQQTTERLGRVLGDEWTLLRGYRNRRGEIDHLLLGPRGLIAIEGKHHNATIHCDGDTWWFDKYDNYGNHVGHGTIQDGGGRSPSRQLNEPAQALEDFLASRGHRVPVRRVVLLTHHRSRLGDCSNPTVDIATSTDTIISLLNNSPPAFEPRQLTQLENLITQDHRFHQRRRRR
jgi:hypothetical protein